MTEATDTRFERYFRYYQRRMVVLLFLILALGAALLAMALDPDSAPARLIGQYAWLLAALIVLLTFTLQKRTLRGERWRPDAPEERAILQDEWRRTNMDRARRVAFVVVLVAQVPIGLLLAHLPSMRAVLAMAVSTITLGVATLIAFYLFFSREESDG